MRRLLTRRWLGYLAVAVVFAIACVALGNWQLSRRAEATERIDRVERNWSAPALTESAAMPALERFDQDLEWHPVELHGSYLPDEQLLARGRPLDGKPGFAVLVPFQLDDGSLVIVDRGWVPVGNSQDLPDTVPAPPSGEVTIVVRLRPGEPSLIGRSAPEGQVASIQLDEIATMLGGRVLTGSYGMLAEERPAPAARPVPAGKPAADEGPHLSYAFQWFVFAILGFVGLVFAIRQELRDPSLPRRQRAKSDAELEDELLDREEAQASATRSA